MHLLMKIFKLNFAKKQNRTMKTHEMLGIFLYNRMSRGMTGPGTSDICKKKIFPNISFVIFHCQFFILL